MGAGAYLVARVAAGYGWGPLSDAGARLSDDPAAPDYNMMVRAPYGFGHEMLRSPGTSTNT